MSEEDVLIKLRKYYSRLYWMIVINSVVVCIALLLVVVSVEIFRLTLLKVSSDVFQTYRYIDEEEAAARAQVESP